MVAIDRFHCNKAYVWNSMLLLCHTDDILSPMYEIATKPMSNEVVSESSVRDRHTFVKSYGRDSRFYA